MAYKGDNSTISLVVENNGFGKPPTAYTGGKMLQNNDGTFNATRNALESEARTPNAELAGVRLGNKNVSATFPVELDPKNYSKLFESVFYGRFDDTGTAQVVAGGTVSAAKKYQLAVNMTAQKQTSLGAKIGNVYRLYGISDAGVQHLEGVVVLIAKSSTQLTFMHPDQKAATISNTTTDISVAPVNTLRPAKQLQSFNAEETLFSEDGASQSRFMTSGAIASGVSIDLPSEGLIKGSFSFIGSEHIASKEYKKFDANLTNGSAAHTSVTPHEKYDPLVLQDGAIISDETDTLCQWLSGTVNIENGAQTFFTGCSYAARGSFSGSFRVTVNAEVLFESEDDYIAFESETSNKMMLRLKDRTTNQCLVMYFPALRKTSYTKNNGKGLVTASIVAQAVVEPEAINSMVMGQYEL